MRVAVIYTKVSEPSAIYTHDIEGRNQNDHVRSVIRALNRLGHKVREYHANIRLWDTLREDKRKIDVVFNLVDDGFFSKSALEPHFPAMLDLLGIRYTGSNYMTLAMCTNKAIAKQCLNHIKIPTAKFQVFKSSEDKLCKMRFPMIVKPIKEDASIGIRNNSVVKNEKSLRKKVESVIRRYKQPAIVEEYIEGRELNIGVMGDTKKWTLPLSEISFDPGFPKHKPKIFTYNAKWKTETAEYKYTTKVFPKLDKRLEKKILRYAIDAADHMGCRDYARVDFRLDKDNRPYVIEINPNPDISDDQGFALMAEKAGMKYDDLIEEIVQCAYKRKKI